MIKITTSKLEDYRGSSFILQSKDYSEVNLERLPCDFFEGESLTGSIFRELDLMDFSFARSDLIGCKFINCNLSNCDLTQAIFDCTFQDCCLNQTIIKCSDLSTVVFKGKNSLEDAHIIRSNFEGISFSKISITGSHLLHCSLTNTKLDRKDLRRTLLCSCDLTSSSLRHTKFDDTMIVSSNLSFCDLHGSNLKELNLVDCRIDGSTGV